MGNYGFMCNGLQNYVLGSKGLCCSKACQQGCDPKFPSLGNNITHVMWPTLIQHFKNEPNLNLPPLTHS